MAPTDRFTWFLEVFPAIIGLFLLAISYARFRFSTMTYGLILLHCLILMVGGHYTYAEVPLFDTFAEWFHWQRNNYDKLGHFAQGFVPAAIAREIIIRREIIKKPTWQNFFVICFCLAFSAFYELIEWWVAIATGDSAEAFLGTQGYQWDTQSDMMLALIGAVCFISLFTRLQDKSIAYLTR
ncbi:MAG: hypothetical protein CR962_00640 [Gammaproteobacteria bacterium]|nr:MAG: hypothetical protein CR962_00640 [Gammaproteobacteria bacterium]